MNELSLLGLGADGWGDELLSGLLVTVQLAVTTLPLGLLIGFAIAGASLSEQPWLRRFGRAYTTAARGIPELLTLFLVYNGIAMLLNAAWRALDPDAGFVELSPFIAGVIALSVVFGAFSGEVLRGAFQALDQGQIEAGQAMGLSRLDQFRFIKLPQIWRFALPGLGNLWVNLIKDTALVSIIALNDLLRMTNIAVGATKQPFTFFFVACAAYWILSILSELVLAVLEKRANRGVRRA
ncbi:ABC transporter permease [Marinobacterium nitratireducens]|uniref:ABC transporter permease n=1 Tax=Marinobacterium nitratireducens TaxID=518897 RepID=A0A917ZRD6_9GAMM|nr:ABC transporter permease [Marinobacterium nitratireducens]GGO89515.1 ABC transporter permease [Marinobacterium nitratireducens]